MQNPTFWPTSENSCSIQVHAIADRKAVLRLDGARRIAFAVRKGPLEVFEVRRTLPWIRRTLAEAVPAASEVYGGDWSDFYGFVAGAKD